MEWETLEHTYTEKTNDWYAAVIMIAGGLIAAGFYINNIMMVVLVVVGTAAFLLQASRQPKVTTIQIGRSGIRAGGTFYPFNTLDAFCIVEHPRENKILLESTKTFMPLVVIPVHPDVDLGELHDILTEYLPEKEMQEPISHVLFERLGF